MGTQDQGLGKGQTFPDSYQPGYFEKTPHFLPWDWLTMLTAALASREATLARPRDLAKVTVSWNLCFRISQAAFLQGLPVFPRAWPGRVLGSRPGGGAWGRGPLDSQLLEATGRLEFSRTACRSSDPEQAASVCGAPGPDPEAASKCPKVEAPGRGQHRLPGTQGAGSCPASPRRWSRLRGFPATTFPSGDKQKGRMRQDPEGWRGEGEKRDRVWGPPWPLSRREGGGLAISPWMSSHSVMVRSQHFPHENGQGFHTPPTYPQHHFPVGVATVLVEELGDQVTTVTLL